MRSKVVVALATCACLSSGCGDPRPSLGRTVLGVVLPPAGHDGRGLGAERMARLALELARSEAPDELRDVALAFRSAAGDDAQVSAALELLDAVGAKALLSPPSPGAAREVVAHAALREAAVLLPWPILSRELYPSASLRLAPTLEEVVCFLARRVSDAGLTRVAIAYAEHGVWPGMAGAFQRAGAVSGRFTGVMAPFPPSTTADGRLNSVLSAQRALAQGVVLLGDPHDAAALMETWVTTGAPTQWFLGPYLDTADFLTKAPKGQLSRAEGVTTTDRRAARDVAALFHARFGYEPEPELMGHFDGVLLFALAVAQARSRELNEGTMVLRELIRASASPPGAPVGFAELDRAFDLIREGADIDLVGASLFKDLGEPYLAGNHSGLGSWGVAIDGALRELSPLDEKPLTCDL